MGSHRSGATRHMTGRASPELAEERSSKVRLSLIGASAMLAAGLALSACSGATGTSTGTPSSGAPVQSMTLQGHQLVTRPMPGVKMLTGPQCGSQYSFCFYVTKGNPGPYVETSDGTSPLYNVGEIVKASNGKKAKHFKDYFYPDPGDPTYQYIIYKGRVPKQPGPVKYTDIYCIGFSASACTNGSGAILYLGIAIE